MLVSRYITKDNYASADLELTPDATYNGMELRCEATSKAIQVPMVATLGKLKVTFPPDFVKISAKPDRPRAGQNMTLICETATSNPASSITWWHNGQRLENSIETTSPADYGGQVTRSLVTVAMTADHHNGVVTCEAKNGENGRRVHDAITLAVNRKSFDTQPRTNCFIVLGGPSVSV